MSGFLGKVWRIQTVRVTAPFGCLIGKRLRARTKRRTVGVGVGKPPTPVWAIVQSPSSDPRVDADRPFLLGLPRGNHRRLSPCLWHGVQFGIPVSTILTIVRRVEGIISDRILASRGQSWTVPLHRFLSAQELDSIILDRPACLRESRATRKATHWSCLHRAY